MRTPRFISFPLLALSAALLLPFGVLAETASENTSHGALISGVLLSLLVVLLAAKIGADVAARLKQPEVLGELCVGVLLGNLALLGFEYFEHLRHDRALEILAELGVILLLFEVGLETNIKEMRRVGFSSLLVAVLGVVVPFFLGASVSWYFLPESPTLVHVFVGATLCATSVGITARVLKDLGKLRTRESKIILGAAVIDDVLGLLVLAVVTGIIQATNKGVELAASAILWKIALAFGFLILAVVVGTYLSPLLFRLATKLRAHGMLLATALLICFGLSYLAALVELAPIVGAFTAGLILEPVHYRELSRRIGDVEIDELIAPITALLVPVFFVSMGAKVDVRSFASTDILLFASCLTLAAIIGKQACALGVLDKGADRTLVGLGMIPRGEVGLIFAGIGYSLTLEGKPVIDTAAFGAVVFMVIVTTMVTPPAISWRFKKHLGPEADTKPVVEPQTAELGAETTRRSAEK